ncbi:MAG: hypothetical protein R2941_25355 [Desulfobacterales bacterium]
MTAKSPDEILIELFCQQVMELGERNDLSAQERERIVTVFRQAMANSFMDDQQIYLKLSGEAV